MGTPSITIGIPAYNEEANIGFLIKDLIRQQTGRINLVKIIVVSDGSTDKTVKIARETGGGMVEVVENPRRQGVSFGLNLLCLISATDALVVLNADVQIKDDLFLEKITRPIFQGSADLVSCPVAEQTPLNYFEEVLRTSMEVKKKVFENYQNGLNVYTCHGRARAFSKRLYKEISFPFSPAEDAYSYFYCLYNGFKYCYVNNTQVYYKLPENMADHQKQSLRFAQSQKILSLVFDKKNINKEYYLPPLLYLKYLTIFFVKKPIHLATYLLVFIFSRSKSYFTKEIKNTWEVSVSSKVFQK